MKKYFFATVFGMTLAALVSGISCRAGAVVDIDAAKKNIQASIDTAREAGDTPDARTELMSMIRYSLHLLRDPGADAKSYKYAQAKMGADVKPTIIASEKPTAVWDDDMRQTISVEASTVYGFQVYMPLQRGFFKNNGNMFLDSYKLEYMLNGEKKSETKEVRRWLNRDTAIDIPIPGIAEWARLEITVAIAKADLDHVFVQLLGRYPLVSDDPASPFAYVVGRLNEALSRLEDDRQPVEAVRLHQEALAGIAKIPSEALKVGEKSSGNAEIAASLENILRLLEGNRIEQDQGMKELKNLIGKLK